MHRSKNVAFSVLNASAIEKEKIQRVYQAQPVIRRETSISMMVANTFSTIKDYSTP